MSGKVQPGRVVRPARKGDEGAWLEMWREFVTIGPEPAAADAPAYVWTQVHDPASPMNLLIAELDGAPVGFLLYVTHPYSWSPRECCYLLDLYVRPAARGKGRGRALIDALAELGRKAGWLRVYWMTQADNAPAQALYDKVAVRSALVRYDMYLSGH